MHQYYAISVLVHLDVWLHIVMHLKFILEKYWSKYDIEETQILHDAQLCLNATLSQCQFTSQG